MTALVILLLTIAALIAFTWFAFALIARFALTFALVFAVSAAWFLGGTDSAHDAREKAQDRIHEARSKAQDKIETAQKAARKAVR